jgi:hypothetical protein
MLIAIVCLLIFLYSVFLHRLGRGDDKLQLGLYGLIAIGFLLSAFILFTTAHPFILNADAQWTAEQKGEDYIELSGNGPTNSFFGSEVTTDANEPNAGTKRTTWGGDIGWIMSIIALIFSVIGYLTFIKIEKESMTGGDFIPVEY